MTLSFKHIAAATMFVAAGLAEAAPVTISVGGSWNGLTATGSATLSFSSDLLDALNVGKIALTNYGAATSTITKDASGNYTSASAAAPGTAVTFDDSTLQVLGVATSGGLTMTAAPISGISTGGSLTVTDLNVDLTNKKIFATIIGANGVGTLTNFELWDIEGTPQYAADGTFLSYDASTAIVGPTTISGPGTYVTQLNGLKITTAGFNTFVKALGLKSLGKSALQGVDNFGTVTSTITATAAIPEPSTYALMGLGLLGMGLVSRRRAK